MAERAYLARLLFEDRKLLDSRLNVCLQGCFIISILSADGGNQASFAITLANCSASGSSLSTSLEKSFSGLNAGSAMMCSIEDVWIGAVRLFQVSWAGRRLHYVRDGFVLLML